MLVVMQWYLRSIIFSILMMAQFVGVSAYAFTCHKAHNSGYLPIFENGRIQRKTIAAEELARESNVKLGGLIEFGERPISPADKEGMLDLFRLYSYASEVSFKQDPNTDKITEILLGLPLTAGYTIDLQFKRLERSIPKESGGRENQDKLVLKEGFLVDSAGIRHKLFGSSILAGNAGKSNLAINQAIVGRLHDFAELENYNFKAFLPAEISGSVLEKFSGVADKLTFMKKEEIGGLADNKQYYKIRFELFRRYVRNRTAHYLFSKGAFKTFTKLAYRTAAIVLILSSPIVLKRVNPEGFDNTVKWVQHAAQFEKDSWVLYTLGQFSVKPDLSPVVKSQLNMLKADFEVKLRNQEVVCSNSCKYPMQLNGPAKTEMANNKYIWIDRKVDPDTNKAVTLVYVARVIDSTGSVAVTTIPIDPKKYVELIKYLENRGQFYFEPASAATSEAIAVRP